MDEISSNDLHKLFLTKETVLSFLKNNLNFLSPFDKTSKGITRVPGPSTRKFETTPTAFCLYYLSNALNSTKDIFIDSRITLSFENVVCKHFPGLLSNFISQHENKETTTTGGLPNNYNTSIQISSILLSSTVAKVSLTARDKNFIKRLVNTQFTKQIEKNNGFVCRLGNGNIPSAYLTYWALEAIIYSDRILELKNISKVYDRILNWAKDTLSKAISYAHAGLNQFFDVVEVIYLILILESLFENSFLNLQESSPVYNAKRLIHHALEITFSEYFLNGCFTKCLPVLADSYCKYP